MDALRYYFKLLRAFFVATLRSRAPGAAGGNVGLVGKTKFCTPPYNRGLIIDFIRPMSDIQIGTIRPRSALAKLAGAAPFSIPLKTVAVHTYAVATTLGDDGLAAVALTMARQIRERGGRVLVVDAAGEQAADCGRLAAEFANAFAMEKWTRAESLVDIKDFLFGQPEVAPYGASSAVVYIAGPLASGDGQQSVSAAVSTIAEAAVQALAEPGGNACTYGRNHRYPLNLVVLRGATLKPTTYSMFRALGVAVLHLSDVFTVDAFMRGNCKTSIRIASCSPDAAEEGASGPAVFEAVVEIGQYLRPSLYQKIDIDAAVLSKPIAPLSLALGSMSVAGKFKWFARREVLALPWSSLLQYVRVEVPATGEAPSTALTISLARQVLAGGGRVIVVDPLAAQGGIIDPFGAQLLHAFPRMRWLDEQEDLSAVPDLFDGDGQAVGERIALFTGEPTTPVLREEGEHGALWHRPVIEAIHMACFARMLSSMKRTSDCPPVLVVLRNIAIDRRTAMHLVELADANVAVMHLDSGRLGEDSFLVVGTVIDDFSEARKTRSRTFSARVRTHSGIASLPFEFAADVASPQQVRDVTDNAHLERAQAQ
jgi:hypothetical protein